LIYYFLACCLRPFQHRNAQLVLNAVEGNTVIVISPMSLATGYKLGGHPMTAIRVDSLPADSTATLDAAVELKILDLICGAIGYVSQLL
jgi:hypothetical protein